MINNNYFTFDKLYEKLINFKYYKFIKKLKKNKNLKLMFKSIKKNYIFYIILSICLILFYKSKNNKKSFFCIINSYFAVVIFGYIIHFLSHNISYVKEYKKRESLFTKIPIINELIINFLKFFDFHHDVHHDSKINQNFKIIIQESLLNFYTQGIFIFLVAKFFKYLDTRMIFLWAFTYTSIHNINYNFYTPKAHKQHHKNLHTNYFMDIIDIILGSKYNNHIEIHNSYSINYIICTIIIIFFTRFF